MEPVISHAQSQAVGIPKVYSNTLVQNKIFHLLHGMSWNYEHKVFPRKWLCMTLEIPWCFLRTGSISQTFLVPTLFSLVTFRLVTPWGSRLWLRVIKKKKRKKISATIGWITFKSGTDILTAHSWNCSKLTSIQFPNRAMVASKPKWMVNMANTIISLQKKPKKQNTGWPKMIWKNVNLLTCLLAQPFRDTWLLFKLPKL